MKLRVYDIIMLKSNDFFLIRNIREERIDGSISKTLFATGFLIKSDEFTIEELQQIEPKKIISKYENDKESEVESIDLEESIKAVISNKKRAEWRLNKKVPIL
jgi:hypothetical protein